jgi:hypothetical protein
MQRRDCAIFAETRFSTGRIAKAILQHNGIHTTQQRQSNNNGDTTMLMENHAIRALHQQQQNQQTNKQTKKLKEWQSAQDVIISNHEIKKAP